MTKRSFHRSLLILVYMALAAWTYGFVYVDLEPECTQTSKTERGLCQGSPAILGAAFWPVYWPLYWSIQIHRGK